MKRRLMIVWLLLTLISVTGAQEETGAVAYQRGDYATAIRSYEGLLTDGVSNAALHTNLGHAYYQVRQTGKALVHYLTAQQLNPRDSSVQMQIARIRGERLDVISSERDLLVITADSTRDLLSLMELGWLVFALWTTFFVLLGLALRRRDGQLRVTLYVLSGIMLITLALFGTRLYVDTQQPIAVVTENRVQVMSGPGDDYLPLFTLFEAAEVRALEQRDEWLRFRLPDGRQGWLRTISVGYIPSNLG